MHAPKEQSRRVDLEMWVGPTPVPKAWRTTTRSLVRSVGPDYKIEGEGERETERERTVGLYARAHTHHPPTTMLKFTYVCAFVCNDGNTHGWRETVDIPPRIRTPSTTIHSPSGRALTRRTMRCRADKDALTLPSSSSGRNGLIHATVGTGKEPLSFGARSASKRAKEKER